MTASRQGSPARARERIQVLCAALGSVPADAVVRPIRSDGAALTAAGRLLEVGAGSSVLERLEAGGDLPVGGAVLTSGGELATPFIIHVVLQSPSEPVSVATVRLALLNVLRRAVDWELESIVLPPLGTGAGNLDAEDVAGVMLPVLLDHLEEGGHPARVLLAVSPGYEEDVFLRTLEAVAAEGGRGQGGRPPTTDDGTSTNDEGTPTNDEGTLTNGGEPTPGGREG